MVFRSLEVKNSSNVNQILLFIYNLGNCKNDTCTRNGILIAGKYLQSENGKYRLDFQNSGLHLSCGYITFKKYGFSINEALYFDAQGLSLVLLNRKDSFDQIFYKSVTLWKAGAEGRANKLVLQNNGNLVLTNGCNKTVWETKTAGACPAGLE